MRKGHPMRMTPQATPEHIESQMEEAPMPPPSGEAKPEVSQTRARVSPRRSKYRVRPIGTSTIRR